MLVFNGHKKIDVGKFLKQLRGAQRSGSSIYNIKNNNAKAEPFHFFEGMQFLNCLEKIKGMPCRQIHHIVAPRRSEDGIKQLHPAVHFFKISQNCSARKKFAQWPVWRVCIDHKRVTAIKQQIIGQQPRQ